MKYLKLKLLNVRGVTKMNKELLETGLAALTEAAELVKQAMAASEVEAKPEGRYKPKYGEEYWCIGGDGNIFSVKWMGSHSSEFRYALGNVYRTVEEAQAALDKQLATVRILDRIAELNAADNNWVADWDDKGQSKYRVTFNAEKHKVCLGSNGCIKSLPDAYYGSEKTIEAVIKEMADDCKLMLEVGQ